ncbi:phytanoyl-CoA dioxygenase family protein [Paenibacillus sp. IB182496]|uniref:Phytanoyl-CoA dioxygenase family protein n=2 Tax=Paenibacillus sabuli TaxID=2772509 RepID=A0A927GQJ3_9BACL|nr:phytanoyl-CoA dioxygenase family protein [Paenibacillus sabuli]
MELEGHLAEGYALSESQIADYARDGHLLLPKVANREILKAFAPAIEEEVKRLNRQDKPLRERDTYGQAFIQISNLWETSAQVRRFVMARRFAGIAARLMQADGVRIYHDQALFKEPGGGHTPWHQDQIYWPLDTTQTITMWMPLVDIPADVGSMSFVSGSYHRGYISKLVISDESHRTLQHYIDGSGMPVVHYGAMQAGDATFHAGWTLHSAPSNPTDAMRKVMTIIYVADGTRILEPDSNARRSDLTRWMPERRPGELADSRLNPLVYSAAGS